MDKDRDAIKKFAFIIAGYKISRRGCSFIEDGAKYYQDLPCQPLCRFIL